MTCQESRENGEEGAETERQTLSKVFARLMGTFKAPAGMDSPDTVLDVEASCSTPL